MATRKIFINPGDQVLVHFIRDPDGEKTASEWSAQARPVRYLLTLREYGVTIHDPLVNAYLEPGLNSRATLLVAPDQAGRE